MRRVESKSTFVIIMAHTTPHTGMLLRKIAKLYTLLDAIMSRKRKAKAKGKGQARKRSQRSERLSVYDVFQIVQSKGITSRLQLVCLAIEQNREGKSSLAQFIANRSNKAVDEALQLAKEFSQAESQSLRTKKTRIELL